MQLVSRLPPLRYRFGLSDPPKAVAPRSVRCFNYNLHHAFQTGELTHIFIITYHNKFHLYKE
ncbi:MAG: hypothetical protein MR739_13360 [Spirochaetia bacterium]|nr:hypothetical protein [Spirochaetia bacterium]